MLDVVEYSYILWESEQMELNIYYNIVDTSMFTRLCDCVFFNII